MGRKKLPDSRDIKKTIRFSDAEYAMLEKAFENSYAGLKNISEFIRHLVLKADELIVKTEETKAKQDGAVINKDIPDTIFFKKTPEKDICPDGMEDTWQDPNRKR